MMISKILGYDVFIFYLYYNKIYVNKVMEIFKLFVLDLIIFIDIVGLNIGIFW